jgi:hypothetical protein
MRWLFLPLLYGCAHESVEVTPGPVQVGNKLDFFVGTWRCKAALPFFLPKTPLTFRVTAQNPTQYLAEYAIEDGSARRCSETWTVASQGFGIISRENFCNTNIQFSAQSDGWDGANLRWTFNALPMKQTIQGARGENHKATLTPVGPRKFKVQIDDGGAGTCERVEL